MARRPQVLLAGVAAFSVVTTLWVLGGTWGVDDTPLSLRSPLPHHPSGETRPPPPVPQKGSRGAAGGSPTASLAVTTSSGSSGGRAAAGGSAASPFFDSLMHTGILRRHTDGTGDAAPLHNGVILILYGGRFGGGYFMNYALPRIQANFLRCFPYPMHIFFEEGVAAEELLRIRKMVPSSNVTFEKISFATLPKGVSEGDVDRWKNEGAQRKFQGRGYRMMCRFWTGAVWTFPSLAKYKYYLRLDTDSIIPAVVPHDPFSRMVESGCVYGFNRLKGENPFVTTKLWETTQRWLAEDPQLTAEAKQRVRGVALRKGAYWGPMYYNNFEVGTFALKNSPVYQSYFRFIDTHQPFGLFRYRWGDAPLHTLAIAAAIESPRQYCNFSRVEFPYQHNPDKKQMKPFGQEPCRGGG